MGIKQESNKAMPKVTIITVTYNAEHYIEKTLKSVKSQTYKNVEHIIIDGDSKDRTNEIVSSYKETISKHIIEPDNGIYDAMNKGIKNASGDYIQFLNAGDTFSNESILEDIFSNINGEDFIYGNTIYVNENGDYIKEWHKKSPKPTKISSKSFANGMVVCHQSMFFKLGKVELFNTNYRISADIDWTIRSMKNCESYYYYNKTICHYLYGGISQVMLFRALKERFFIVTKNFSFFRAIFTAIIMPIVNKVF